MISNKEIQQTVQHALDEDLGSGDLTAGLIPNDIQSSASIISRENAIFCGKLWVDETFRQLDPDISIDWKLDEGDNIIADQELCTITGPASVLLSGERTALNFLQTLSGTATLARTYADCVSDLPVRILDTRKTIPGLRMAQKYAVRCGSCFNHRKGLYDAILIKENHIIACGSVSEAIHIARRNAAGLPVEIEVETIAEVKQALAAGADALLLDNFSLEMLQQAVKLSNGRVKLEASGGITLDNLYDIALTGVDFISIGALTKDIQSIDLSMRFDNQLNNRDGTKSNPS